MFDHILVLAGGLWTLTVVKHTSPQVHVVSFVDEKTAVGDGARWKDADALVLTNSDLVLHVRVGHGSLGDFVGNEALPLEEPVTGDHVPLLRIALLALFLVVWVTVQF